MTIDNSQVIDFLVSDHDEQVTMIIADHWGWEPHEEAEHARLLKYKINGYIACVESGELQEVYAKAFNRTLSPTANIEFQIVAKYEMSTAAEQVFQYSQNILVNAGYLLTFKKWAPKP